jgi:flagellar biosynthetic protein FliQ
MTAADAIDLVHASIWIALIVATPCVAAAMVIGFIISLLQALTQIQEATLSFVPKIIGVLLVAGVASSFMGRTIYAFAIEIYSRIPNGF